MLLQHYMLCFSKLSVQQIKSTWTIPTLLRLKWSLLEYIHKYKALIIKKNSQVEVFIIKLSKDIPSSAGSNSFFLPNLV